MCFYNFICGGIYYTFFFLYLINILVYKQIHILQISKEGLQHYYCIVLFKEENTLSITLKVLQLPQGGKVNRIKKCQLLTIKQIQERLELWKIIVCRTGNVLFFSPLSLLHVFLLSITQMFGTRH